MDHQELKQAIRENPRLLRFKARSLHPATIADILIEYEKPALVKILNMLPPLVKADVFSHFEDEDQLEIFLTMSHSEKTNLITNMYHDDRVALIKLLPKEESQDVLAMLSEKVRNDIQELSSYKEKTAGSIMTSKFLYVTDDMSAEQTIDYVRRIAKEIETPYDIYVVDLQNKLIGSITLKDLILSSPNQLVKDLMTSDLIYAVTSDSRESAVKKISKYDIISLPVVDEQESLVGIITYDDAFDAMESEYTEDMEKFMAISGSHTDESYFSISVFRHFSNRIVWVVILAFVGLLSGVVLHRYEDTLSQFMILALYLPMLMDTGGNTGSQAATIVIRSLAIGDIEGSDLLKVLWKEFQVSFLTAIVIAFIAFSRVMLMSRGTIIPSEYLLVDIAFAIAIALSLQVISSTIVGAALPLIVSKLKMDPAVVASPAITTIVDITGLLIYFASVTIILGL
ncbi:MAG: magnesium transporter [Sphaerochaetaceae bacterium]|jgi:magnesium transporter